MPCIIIWISRTCTLKWYKASVIKLRKLIMLIYSAIIELLTIRNILNCFQKSISFIQFIIRSIHVLSVDTIINAYYYYEI